MADASEKTQDTTPEVQVITGKAAAKLLRLTERVAARKGFAVGLLARVADGLRGVHQIMLVAQKDNTAITVSEVQLTLAFVKRLERRIRELAEQRIHGMQEALKGLETLSRVLEEADRGGYKLAKLQEQAESDRRTLDRLRASIKARVTESAAVLAELEQVVDPLPGMRLVSGKQRDHGLGQVTLAGIQC